MHLHPLEVRLCIVGLVEVLVVVNSCLVDRHIPGRSGNHRQLLMVSYQLIIIIITTLERNIAIITTMTIITTITIITITIIITAPRRP